MPTSIPPIARKPGRIRPARRMTETLDTVREGVATTIPLTTEFSRRDQAPGTPRGSILASGSSVVPTPSRGLADRNGHPSRRGRICRTHTRLQWRDRCGFSPHSSVPEARSL